MLRLAHRKARARTHRTLSSAVDAARARSPRPARAPQFLAEPLESRQLLSGSWTQLAHAPATDGLGTMLLLSDGSVMAEGPGVSKAWYKLTPDINGSYANGTWTQLASMSTQRLYFASQVLKDGRVFVLGGEYTGPQGHSTWSNTGEIYNPVTNSWSRIPNIPTSEFGDVPTALLPDGRVLAGSLTDDQTYIYDPATNAWSNGPTKLFGDRSDEESWVKLPDDSILSYDVFNNTQHAQRFDPVLNEWVDAGAVPVQLETSDGKELGPALHLYDGRVLFIGGTNHNAIYTPPADRTGTGSWAALPDTPGGLGANDAPAAILPNGVVLYAAGDTSTDFNPPTALFEFDPSSDTISPAPTAGGPDLSNSPAFTSRMLVLPSGQVLFGTGDKQLYLYTPSTGPDDAWRPAVSSIAPLPGSTTTYTLTGTQLNGLSEGASYGDDAEMSSNYPILRFRDANGHYFFARSFNWSSTGVATGSTPVTVQFTLPSRLNLAGATLAVVANGIASDEFDLSSLTANPNGPYTVLEGGSVTLSAAGSAGLITSYQWDTNYDGVTFHTLRTGATPTFTATGLDGPSTRTIALRVSNPDGTSSIQTTTLSITNAPPTASFPNASFAENAAAATVRLSNPTDPSPADLAAGLLFSFDFGNDGTFEVVDAASPIAAVPPSFLADGPSSFTVLARVTDRDGDSSEYTATFTVTNAPPTATFAVPATVPQDSTTATVSFLSPVDGADDLAAGLLYSFDFNNDGTYDIVDSTSPTATLPASVVGDNPVTRTIRGRVRDRDGASTSYTATFAIVDAPPTATPSITAGDEGSDVTVSLASPADPSPVDTAAGFKYSFDFGNDGTFEVVDSASPSFTHVIPDQGTIPVLARIRDRLGGHTDYLLTASAANLAPTSSLSSGGAVNEGSPGAVSFGPVTDPAPADTAAGFTYSYDFDDDGTFEIADSPNPSATVPASFLADGPFVRTVRARVADKDGGYTDYTTTLTVRDVPPTLVTPAAANGNTVLGTGYTLSLSAHDPGTDSVSSWFVDWGDGQTSLASTPAALFTHDYDAKGDYSVLVTAADEDGAGYSLTRTVHITSDPPTASLDSGALTPDASAFQFTLTYEDDLGVVPSSLGDADLSVTGPHGPARSVQLLSTAPTPDGRGVVATYAATGPAGDWGWQDDGVYTVSVNPAQITDLQGDSAPSTAAGTFYVNLAAPDAPDLVAVYTGHVKLRPTGVNTATVKVYNRGTRNLDPARVTTSLYLSTDRTWDPSDTLLASSTQKFGLVLNAFHRVTFSFPTPAVPATGKYYLLARADTRSAINERDERNNATPSNKVPLKASRPDVSASLAGHLKHAYRAGQSLPISLRLTNRSAAPTGPLGVEFVLSADSHLDSSDLPLLTTTLPSTLAGHASSLFSLSATLPADTAGHRWHLLAILTNAAHPHAAVSSPFSVKPIR